MVRDDTFALRITRDERQLLAGLAKRLQRTQSDTVRLLIREAARELVSQQQTAVGGQHGQQ